MKKPFAMALAVVLVLLVGAVAFEAYFVRNQDPDDGLVYDGFGRPLSEPPLWAKVFATEEALWSGLGWQLVDVLVIGGGLLGALKLYAFTQRKA